MQMWLRKLLLVIGLFLWKQSVTWKGQLECGARLEGRREART